MASYTGISPKFFGILNITPDSFSDGGEYLAFENALGHAKKLKHDGADCIDIGGDSSRPGSVCAGAETEIARIRDIVKETSKFAKVSVDTHHALVAKEAIESGASVINDISSGNDPEMLPLIAQSAKQIVLTYTRCPKPHDFSLLPCGDIIDLIKAHFYSVLTRAAKAGVRESQIILDPGMGAFLSDDPAVSWELLGRLHELKEFRLPFMLSVSRKGFLKPKGQKVSAFRDLISAHISIVAAFAGGLDTEYLRVHDVKTHKEFLGLLSV